MVRLSSRATNFVSVQNQQALDDAPAAPRAQVLQWELELCREPEALDPGTHILAVVRKPKQAHPL